MSTETSPSSSVCFATTVIDWPQQEEFANFSGDRNPMHTDALAARRTPPGAVVVYGMHLLLWALENLADRGSLRSDLSRILIDFLKWIYLGDPIELWFTKGTGKTPDRVQVRVADVVAIAISLSHHDAAAVSEGRTEPVIQSKRSVPRELSIEKIAAQQGAFLPADETASASLFPSLASKLGPRFAAEIATCSYLVGMETPGLYSIDSQADLGVFPASLQEIMPQVSYKVESVDARFRRVALHVRGQAISGVLRAFVRNPPVLQPSVAEVAKHVSCSEFQQVRALVVGGSRGLGEVAAKCIAAGGGHCTVTYAVGRQDAQEVVRQIVQAGGHATVACYDMRESAAAQIANLHGQFTHLLYFATGPMFRAKSAVLAPARLAEFFQFYVRGFHDLCAELAHAGKVQSGASLTVFYPSSEALDKDSSGLAEFAAAKAAGERVCRDLERAFPGLRVLTTRLPKLLTDQTASLIPERLPDTIQALLPSLRELQTGQ